MTRVTSRSEPFLQSVRVTLRFSSTHVIRFSSGLLLAILKNTVRVQLRFDNNSVKPVYKTPVRVGFDSLSRKAFYMLPFFVEKLFFSKKKLSIRV